MEMSMKMELKLRPGMPQEAITGLCLPVGLALLKSLEEMQIAGTLVEVIPNPNEKDAVELKISDIAISRLEHLHHQICLRDSYGNCFGQTAHRYLDNSGRSSIYFREDRLVLFEEKRPSYIEAITRFLAYAREFLSTFSFCEK